MKEHQKINLTDEMIKNFADLTELCSEQLDLVIVNLSSTSRPELDQKIQEIYSKSNKFLQKLQTEHFKSLKKGTYKCKDGIVYSDIYTELGIIGKFAFEINEQLAGVNVLEEFS
jgi:Na+/phosphate symporter